MGGVSNRVGSEATEGRRWDGAGKWGEGKGSGCGGKVGCRGGGWSLGGEVRLGGEGGGGVKWQYRIDTRGKQAEGAEGGGPSAE